MQITEVIKRPLITEKSHQAIAQRNEYTLVVAQKANKSIVKQAVKKLFGVDVVRVRIINMPHKPRRTGRLRRQTKLSGFKKAIVRLPEDQKIPLFELEKETKSKK